MAELLKLLGAVAAIYNLLGPWGTLVLVAVVAVACRLLYTHGGDLLGWMLVRTARSLGAVLRDAAVTIHSVTPAPEPDRSVWVRDEDDEEFEAQLEASGLPEGQYDWYHIDVTITPRPTHTPGEDGGWEPGILQLTRAGHKLDALEIDTDCLIAQVEWFRDGKFEVCDTGTAYREQRLRLYAGFTPGTNQARLVYLGHTFGDVPLARARHADAAPAYGG